MGVVWCGVVWCGVRGVGVVWCGVVWCGVIVFAYVHNEQVEVFKSVCALTECCLN